MAGTASIAARAVDTAGNSSTSASALVTSSNPPADTTAPVSRATCDGGVCSGTHAAGTLVGLRGERRRLGCGADPLHHGRQHPDRPRTARSTPPPFALAATTTVQLRRLRRPRATRRPSTASPSPSMPARPDRLCDLRRRGLRCRLEVRPGHGRAGGGRRRLGREPHRLHARRIPRRRRPTATSMPPPFSVAASATVRYRSIDNAGGLSDVGSATIRIDGLAPSHGGILRRELPAPRLGDRPGGGHIRRDRRRLRRGEDGLHHRRHRSERLQHGRERPGHRGVHDAAPCASGRTTTPATRRRCMPADHHRGLHGACHRRVVQRRRVFLGDQLPGSAERHPRSKRCRVGRSSRSKHHRRAASSPWLRPARSMRAHSRSAAAATLTYRAFDVAGNAETPTSIALTVTTAPTDSTAPATTASCTGGACSDWHNATVDVTLAATDDLSGVAEHALHDRWERPDSDDRNCLHGPDRARRDDDAAGTAAMTPRGTRRRCSRCRCGSTRTAPDRERVVPRRRVPDRLVAHGGQRHPDGCRHRRLGRGAGPSTRRTAAPPSATNGTAYAGPIAVTTSVTLRLCPAIDAAGTTSTVGSLALRVDVDAPVGDRHVQRRDVRCGVVRIADGCSALPRRPTPGPPASRRSGTRRTAPIRPRRVPRTTRRSPSARRAATASARTTWRATPGRSCGSTCRSTARFR